MSALARRVLLERHGLALLAILVFYMALGTGLTWNLSPAPLAPRDYFGLQAESWVQGRLDLGLTPDQAKLDMSVFEGEVHLYWGPGNSLGPFLVLLAGLRLSVALWGALATAAGVAVWDAVFRRAVRAAHPEAPRWLPLLFTATLALGTPIIALGAGGAFVHLQSIGLSLLAQGLTVLAFLRVCERGGKRDIALLAVAASFALSVRLTSAFLLLGLAITGLVHAQPPRIPWLIRRFGVPVLAVAHTVGALALLNAARFEGPVDTGMRHATGVADQRALLDEAGAVISPRWVSLNTWGYFVRWPVEWDGPWPVWQWGETIPVPDSLRDLYPPDDEVLIDTAALPLMTPAIMFALLLLVPATRRLVTSHAPTFALAALGPLLFLLFYSHIARRFTADFVPAWLALSALAAAAHLRAHPRHTVPLLTALVTFTVWSALTHLQLGWLCARKVNAMLLLADAGSTRALEFFPLWKAVVLGAVAANALLLVRRPEKEVA